MRCFEVRSEAPAMDVGERSEASVRRIKFFIAPERLATPRRVSWVPIRAHPRGPSGRIITTSSSPSSLTAAGNRSTFPVSFPQLHPCWGRCR